MTWPGRISVGSVMWLMRFSTLSVVPNLSGDRAQRVAGLHLVALAVGSGRRLRRRPRGRGRTGGRRGRCRRATGVASRRRRHDRESRGGRRRLPRAGSTATTCGRRSAAGRRRPSARSARPGRPRACAIRSARTAGARARGPAASSAVAGHRVGSPSRARARAFRSRASRAPGRRGTWRTSGVRRRGTAGAASRASAGLRGSTAPQRCSRIACALCQEPSPATRYGQTSRAPDPALARGDAVAGAPGCWSSPGRTGSPVTVMPRRG